MTRGPCRQKLRDLLGNGIFAVDGAKWMHQPKTASNLFSLRTLRESMTESVQKHAFVLNEILQRISQSSESSSFDLFSLMNCFTIDTFAATGFGAELGCLGYYKDHPFQATFDSTQRVRLYR